MDVFLFNPEHDLALADGGHGYVAPRSALQFGKDCACLPVWYAGAGSGVLVEGGGAEVAESWLRGMRRFFPCLEGVHVCEDVGAGDVLVPWGYDAALYGRVGAVDMERVALVRRYSHRAWGRDLLGGLQPYVAEVLESLEDVERFADVHGGKVVLKAPWSGSGRGVVVWDDDRSVRGWAKKVLLHQGVLLGEPLLVKRQDFAMEFSLRDGVCRFEGYSLFAADEKGVYRYSCLLGDEAIEGRLGVDVALLHEVRGALVEVLPVRYAGYEGVVGVDMMVYDDGGVLRVNPLVEVNLRMTMGLVARRFYDGFVGEGCEGRLSVVHVGSGLMATGKELERSCPAVVRDGRLVEGCMFLTPLVEGTEYGLVVEVERD